MQAHKGVCEWPARFSLPVSQPSSGRKLILAAEESSIKQASACFNFSIL